MLFKTEIFKFRPHLYSARNNQSLLFVILYVKYGSLAVNIRYKHGIALLKRGDRISRGGMLCYGVGTFLKLA